MKEQETRLCECDESASLAWSAKDSGTRAAGPEVTGDEFGRYRFCLARANIFELSALSKLVRLPTRKIDAMIEKESVRKLKLLSEIPK